MEITNHAYQNRHITLVQGLVQQQAFSEIRQALAGATEGNAKQLWIDCSHVDRNDLTSSHLCAYVNELLKIRNEQVQVTLCGMDKTTERLFLHLGLDMLFSKARAADDAFQPTAKRQFFAA